MGKRVALVGFSLATAVAVGAGGVYAAKQVRANISSNQQCAMIESIEQRVDVARDMAAGTDPTIAVLGDSYAQGVGLADPMTAYPYALGDAVLVNGSGGSGFVSDGPCDDAMFIDRLSTVIATEPDVLIVQGGINDRGNADVGIAAMSLLDRVESESPDTQVVLVGPFAPASVAGEELEAVNRELQVAAESRGVEYVDPSGWEFALQEDELHPSPEGHEQIAEHLRDALPDIPR